jgi:predicted dehydrogenase
MRPTPAGGVGRSPIRIGIIGCGATTQLAHLPILNKLRGVTVGALCDNDSAKVRTLAQRFEVPDYFTDIDDMFSAVTLDAVVVSTPNHLHEPHTLSALRAGVDVLCDRPLALTARAVQTVLDAAEKSGRKLVASNPLRFRTDVQGLAGFLRGGELGKIIGIRADEYHRRGSVDGWRLRRAESGGGAFIEYGYALLDLALWLADFPAPERVSAHFARGAGAGAVEDTMVVLVVCAGGIAFTSSITWSFVGDDDRWTFEVLATEGSGHLAPLHVVKDLGGGRPRDVSPSGAPMRDAPLMQSHRAALAHFVAVLREEVPYDPPTDQLAVIRVIEAAYRSAEHQTEIRL